MNKKGFTLIELLAIIVIIALVAVLASPSIIGLFNTSKDKLYDIMIDNIKTAGENYYQECEYGNSGITCNKEDNNYVVTLGKLVEMGLLKSDSENTQTKIIKNPKTGTDISSYKIRIIKNTSNPKDMISICSVIEGSSSNEISNDISSCS